MLPALARAQEWAAAGVEVTLVDPQRHLYYSGMVPEYLGGVYDASAVRVDLAARAHEQGARFVQAPAAAIRPHESVVQTANGTTHPYDVLAIDVGSVNPSVPAGAIATKPIHRVRALAEQLETTLSSPTNRLRLVMVGGGAAGTEVALNVTGRFAGAGRLGDLELTVIEQADRLLPAFPSGMSATAARRLRRRGTAIRTGTAVTAVDPVDADNIRVHTDRGSLLDADAVLWATGTVGPSLLHDSPLPTDDRGFVRVTRPLRVGSHPRIFAAGDCATVDGLDLARVGVHAVKQGPTLRTNLDRTLRSLRDNQKTPPAEALQPFRPYPVTPLILSTGAADGLWTAGPLWAAHPWLLRLKHWIDRRWIRQYAPEHWQHASWRNLLGAESAAGAAR